MVSSSIRAFVYSLLKTDTALNAVISGRVFQQGSLITAQQAKPYLVFHFGHHTDEGIASEDPRYAPSRQYLEIYIHVAQGDFGPVDDLTSLVSAAMQSRVGAPSNFIHAQYLETSQDLQDSLLQTYSRYMRYQLIQAR